MFDHVEYFVSDFEAARLFYSACLHAIGWRPLKEDRKAGILGYGSEGIIKLHLTAGRPVTPPVHVAFRAASRRAAHEFYQAGLLANGRDNGPPGPRDYAKHYYAAFLYDLDNDNIEAVYRGQS